MKSAFVSNKDKTITLEATNLVTSLDNLEILPTMDYNIIDDMNKVHVNISMFQLTKIMSQWDILLQEHGQTTAGNVVSLDKVYGKSYGSLKYVLNNLTMDANTLCPPFLLTFEIFNFNVHNFLVDSGASVNIMPLFVSKKINEKWDKKMHMLFNYM